MLLHILLTFMLSCHSFLYGSEDPPRIEVCKNDSQEYKHEQFVNLKDLEIVYRVSVTLQDGLTADKNDVRVLAGRIHPRCDANLRTYVFCTSMSDYQTFQCPQNQLFSRIVVQSKLKIAEVSDRTFPPLPPDLTTMKEEMAATQEFRMSAVQELKIGVTSLNIHPWPSVIYLINPYSLPIALTGKENKVFMGVVATGKGGSGGKIVVCNDRQQYYNLDSNKQLYNNLIKWMTGGKIESIDEIPKMKSETLENDYPAYNVVLWDAHTAILNKRELSMLENKVKSEGLNIIIFVNSWYYNRDVEKLNKSKFVKFLKKFGVVLTNEYIYEKQKRNININWDKVQEMRSGLETLKQMSQDIGSFKENIKQWLEDEDTTLKLYEPLFLQLYRNHLPQLENTMPCRFTKLEDPERMKIVEAFNYIFNELSYLNAPPIYIYPGDLKSKSPLLNVDLEIKCESNREAVPTGYYLPAGHTMRAKYLGGKMIGWRPYVGYNFFDVTKKSYYYKFPQNYQTIENWFTESNSIYTPFGGLVFIHCLHKNSILKAKLSNVVQAPFLDLRDAKSLADWQTRQKTNAPWAVVAADSVVMTTKSRTVVDQPTLAESLVVFDKCNKYQHYMVGLDVSKSSREFISFDYQGLTSWMASGYPISAYLSSVEPGYSTNPFNLTGLLTLGSWGLFHEMGHNRQESLWTSTVTRQVTNNILTLGCQELIAGQTVWRRDSDWLTVYNYLDTKFLPYLRKEVSGKSLDWGYSPWVTLAIYIQLQDNFGWEFYKQIFRSYASMSLEQKTSITSGGDQVIHDEWFKQACLVSSYNLAPLFIFWRVPISQSVLNSFKNLPAFFPDDFVTQSVPEITEDILREFPKVARKAKPVPIAVERFEYKGQERPPQVKVLKETSSGDFAAPRYYGECKNRAA